MLSNSLTILVVPSKKGTVLRFALSSFLLKVLLVSFGIFILISLAVTIDYISVRSQENKQNQLENSVMLQKFTLQKIENQLIDTNDQLRNMEEFDKKLRVISGLEESSTQIEYMGKTLDTADADSVFNPKKSASILEKLKKLDLDIKLREFSFFQLEAELQARKDRLSRTPSIAPVKGRISSPYGKRKDPFTGKTTFHSGLDIPAPSNTPVYAPADGDVVNTFVNGSFGNFLVISHGYNVTTRYGHLSKYEVKSGQKVKRGDLIARVGSTGKSTAPHLHYEVLKNEQFQDPRNYILQLQY